MEKYEKFWSRDYSVHYNEIIIRTIMKHSQEFNIPVFFYTFNQGFSVAATTAKIKKDLYQRLAKKFLKNRGSFEKFKNELDKICRAYLDTALPYQNLDLKNYSNEKIIEILNAYYRAWTPFGKILFWAFALSETHTPKTNEMIKLLAFKAGKAGRLSAYLATANQPYKKSSIYLLEDSIAKSRGRMSEGEIKKTFEKYRWLPFGDLNGNELKLAEFEKFVRGKRPDKEKNIPFSRLKAELKLSAKEIEMIGINQELAYLRDYRDEVRRRAVYAIHFVYREAARRLKISYRDLLFFSTPETIEFLRGKPVPKKELTRRHKPGALIWRKNKLVFLTGPEAKKYFKRVEQKGAGEIRGAIAFAGKVKGKARVIRLDREINKFKQGEIMITVTTHPDYLPKMRLAKAIVTDEGGMTCHAAIVARELKIPCVVGTKVATETLKDGDLVEVDAGQGTVRKIK